MSVVCAARDHVRWSVRTLGFIEGEQDECPVGVEVLVTEEWDEPVVEPVSDKVNRSVVAL